MLAIFLLVSQFITGDVLGLDVLETGIAQLRKIRRAEGGAVNGLECGFLEWIVDQSQARIEGGIKIAVLVITQAAIEMEVLKQRNIALEINPVTFPGAGDRRLTGQFRLLFKIIAVFCAHGKDVPVPQALVELNFRAPPFARVPLHVENLWSKRITNLMIIGVVIKPGRHIEI